MCVSTEMPNYTQYIGSLWSAFSHYKEKSDCVYCILSCVLEFY